MIKYRSKMSLILFILGFSYLTISSYTRGAKRDLDFKVFHKVGERLIANDLDIYNFKKDGIFSYKYSPFAAIVFQPLAFTDLKTAQKIWCFFNAVLLIFSFYLSWLILKYYYPSINFSNEILFLTLIATARPILNNAMQANINLYLYFLMILSAWLSVIKKQQLLAGLPLALAASIKIVPLSLIGFFLFTKRFKALFSSVSITVILSAIPFLYFGTDETFQLFKDWTTILADKNHDPYFKWTNQSSYVVWLHILNNDDIASIIHKLHVFIAFPIFLYLVYKNNEALILSFCFIAILLVSPVVRIEYYVMLILPFFVIHQELFLNSDKLWRTLFWLRFVFSYFLGKFLIGKYAAEMISYYGQMYWGLVILIILFILCAINIKKEKA